MANPVVHFEIMGKDGDKLQQFYSTLFGWSIDASNPMKYGLVAKGSDEGIGGGIGSSGDVPAYVTVYVKVDNLQAYLDKAHEMGGKTIVPITEIPNMVTFAMFQDPEGNCVGLVKG